MIPAEIPRFDRRRFFKILGGGVAVLVLSESAGAQESGRRGGRGNRPMELGAWIHIAEDGTVTVFTGKTEVGQNIRTSLTQAVAEELHVSAAAIRMVMADTDLVPYDAGTFGSRTTPDMALHLRRASATARETLIDLAAKTLGTDRSVLVAKDGVVTGGSRPISFGELSRGQTLVATITDQVAITPADRWRIAGTSIPKVNGKDFVTGKHRFTTDIQREGMLQGKVVRPAAFEAELESVDTAKAAVLEGTTVFAQDGFIGVAARDAGTLEKAAGLVDARWKAKPQISNKELFDTLKETGAQGGRGDRAGSVENGMSAAAHRLAERYTVDYIAHAPLEPRAAVAEWIEGKLTVWTGTQRPFGVKSELMQAFELPEDKVRVIVPDTGSGYGGKHSGETAIEAARLAKASGKPVKVVWSREEEFTWAYFRPAGVIEVNASITADGLLTAWDFHNYNSGGAAIATPYHVENRVVEYHGSRSPLRQGSYRGLASAANCFARESHMDGLARLAGIDPLEFRLKNLRDARLHAVLEAAAEKFDWGKNPGASGIACGIDKGGYLATCVEIEMTDGVAKVKRITAAFECGAVVHPEHVRAQVEGSIVMGIGGALFESITFADGRILNPMFSKYRVPRFSDVPPIEIVILDRKDLPSAGAGEAPILGIAPAIGNAIRALTGKGPTRLPMNPA